MNQEKVQDLLQQISGMTEEETAAYSKVTELACARAEAQLKHSGDADDARTLAYAAAMAYYMICLCEDAKNDITSFTAGDISITGNASRTEAARQLLQTAEKNCAGMLQAGAFAFMGV